MWVFSVAMVTTEIYTIVQNHFGNIFVNYKVLYLSYLQVMVLDPYASFWHWYFHCHKPEQEDLQLLLM